MFSIGPIRHATSFQSIPPSNLFISSSFQDSASLERSTGNHSVFSGSPILVLRAHLIWTLCDSLAVINADFCCCLASSLAYTSTSSAPMNLPHTNGRLSPPADDFANVAIAPSSESDLSDAIDPPNSTIPSLHPNAQGTYDNEFNSIQDSISSHDEDAIGSDDADYEMESPPPPQVQITRDDRSSSQGSPRPSKRKSGIEEDEYIMNNPELYGIRRSVRHSMI